MTTTDPNEFLRLRLRLAVELRRRRERAGLGVHELADQLDWSPSKVSKIENGRVSVKIPDAKAWAEATGEAAGQLEQLLELAELARTEFVTRRFISEQDDGFARKQRQFAAVELTARTIRNFHPTYPPGLLQTPEIMRRILAASTWERPEEELAAIVAAKVDRQALLYDTTRRFEFVITEAVFRWRFGPPAMMLALLDRIATVATLPNVTIGVIPSTVEAAVWHNHGFVLFDDRTEDEEPLVSVELLDGEHVVTDPEAVARYQTVFGHLSEVAMRDTDAQTLLHAVMADLRKQGSLG
jgi:transcriptional regulator with XRE-family HTH domain